MGNLINIIFEDDIAADIKAEFEELIEDGGSVKDVTETILEEYEDIIEEGSDESQSIYLALAALQVEYGYLHEDIKDMALELIGSGRALEAWEDAEEDEFEQRKKALKELKSKLQKY